MTIQTTPILKRFSTGRANKRFCSWWHKIFTKYLDTPFVLGYATTVGASHFRMSVLACLIQKLPAREVPATMSSRGRVGGIKSAVVAGLSEESSNGVKRKGSGGWVFAVIMMCGGMYLATMLVGQATPSAINMVADSQQSAIPAELKGDIVPVEQSQFSLNSVIPSSNSQFVQKAETATESTRLKAFSAASMSIQRNKEKEMAMKGDSFNNQKQYDVSVAALNQDTSSNWVPPPSQANYGKTNARNIPRPKLKPPAENFVKARKSVWEK